MTYSISREEPVSDAVRRIMAEQIVRAGEHLTSKELTPARRVHETRKRFKEARALLRLVREPLGDDFAPENAWFRDAGRELAAVRDADAVLEALETLELPRLLRNRVKRQLRGRRDAPATDALIARTAGQLVVPQTRIGLWPRIGDESGDGFDTIAPGLLRTYREARRRTRTASTAEELHEWRKHVKTHWYHVQLLREVWPAMMKPWAGVLHDLSGSLGGHHDLEVLRGMISEPPSELLAAIDARQRTLENDSAAMGKRLFAEKPRTWLARMRRYWSAWR